MIIGKFLKKHFLDIVFLIFIGFVIYFFVNIKTFWPILLPFIIALFLSYLLKPMVDFLETKIKSRDISILLSFILAFSIAILIFVYFIPLFITEMRQLIQNIPEYINLFNKWFKEIDSKLSNKVNIDLEEILRSNSINVEAISKQVLTTFLNILKSIYSNILYYLLIPIISFYILKDWTKIVKWIKWVLPEKYRKEGISIFNDINKVLHQYIRAQLLDAIIVGILSFLGFSILSVRYAALLGIIAGIGNLIPYFGPIFASIPAIVIALSDSYIKAILVIVFLVVLQQVDSFLISPRIIGSRLGLHPLTIIIVLIISNKLFGFISMFFAIPLAAVIKIVFINILRRVHPEDKK
ncbi:AI-2E family transporter [Caldicellulosiruptor naganoensis]|uniref:AI-2E family transporter n=1 Tax=Caldicellulosiruptor naganoensis TaxID=29324 RepID=A0ABY7BCS3_9FIRM|nr:AI-2E family transporter [Caldicellulosiruptor naganoensis]WAM30634.1 AI-2E family transporter [Caldicellulosiruptor naganoensis]